MSRLLLSAFSMIFFISLLQAQDPVGHYFDINGEYIDGYLDPFSYAPEKRLFMIYNFYGYDQGTYYASNGTEVKGYIQNFKSHLRYKETVSDSYKKLNADELIGAKIGLDSFFVINNFKTIQGTRIDDQNDARLFKVSAKYENYSFADPQSIEINWQYQKNGSDTWHPVPADKVDFRTFCKDVFPDVAPLNAILEMNSKAKSKSKGAELYSYYEIFNLIDIAVKWAKYESGDPIYYDKYWNEVESEKYAVFHAIINHCEDSIWQLSYFEGNTKRFDVSVSQFNPIFKNGNFSSFDSLGNIHKELEYRNDTIVAEKYYYPNGNMFIETKMVGSLVKNKRVESRKITHCYTADGAEVMLSDESTTTMQYLDSITKRTLQFKIDNAEWNEVNATAENDGVLLLSDPNYDLNLAKLQKKIIDGLYGQSFLKAYKNKARGTILLKMELGTKGYVNKAERLNSLSPDVDEFVDQLIRNNLLPTAQFRIKFKPYKKGKEKRAVEMVIPLTFDIYRTYAPTDNYSWLMTFATGFLRYL